MLKMSKMELAIILWTSVFWEIGLLIQNCGEKVTTIRVLAVTFIFGLGAKFLRNQPSSFLFLPVLGTQSSCLSLEPSCEEFKGALSRSANPRNVLHADFSQNFNVMKLTMEPSFLWLSNKCKNIWHAISTFATFWLVFASEKYCQEESFLCLFISSVSRSYWVYVLPWWQRFHQTFKDTLITSKVLSEEVIFKNPKNAIWALFPFRTWKEKFRFIWIVVVVVDGVYGG